MGYFKECSFLPVTNTVKRAMDIAIKALESQGYELVEFDINEEITIAGKLYL